MELVDQRRGKHAKGCFCVFIGGHKIRGGKEVKTVN